LPSSTVERCNRGRSHGPERRQLRDVGAHVFGSEVGVAARQLQRRLPERLLHALKAGAIDGEVRGVRVPHAARERIAQYVMLLYNERNNIAHGGPTEQFRTPRFEARRLFREVFARLLLRRDLRALSSDQFDEYWNGHRFR
jgi:hypothetical protein